jgi:hypothetical protein
MYEIATVTPLVVMLVAFIISVFLIFEGIEFIRAGEWKLSIFFFFFTLLSMGIAYSNYTLIREKF